MHGQCAVFLLGSSLARRVAISRFSDAHKFLIELIQKIWSDNYDQRLGRWLKPCELQQCSHADYLVSLVTCRQQVI